MKKALLIALVLGAFVMMGCQTTVPAGVLGGGTGKVGSKVGEASAKFIFGFPSGAADFGLKAAAANGGIKEIGTVDVRVEWPGIPIIMTVTTVVTGE